jgi:carbon storage regulator
VLVLTRRVGESIRIGDSLRLTVRAKLRGHITLTLYAPTRARLTDDADNQLLPQKCGRHRHLYRISLLLGDSLRIGEVVTVWIGGGPKRGRMAPVRGGQVRIGIEAPECVKVYREELYQRIRRGEPAPCGEAV